MSPKDTMLQMRRGGDPLALMRQVSSAFDRLFDDPFWPMYRPLSARLAAREGWMPDIDVFERDNRVVTRIDLPGMQKQDVKVEVTDGHLFISGERKMETEEKTDRVYRSERQYGSFSRAVPLPEGVTLEDVKATFAHGVLEVSVPVPAEPQAKIRTVDIQEPPKAAKPAA